MSVKFRFADGFLKSVAMPLVLCVLSTSSVAYAGNASPSSASSAQSALQGGDEDCMTIGNRSEREACFAKESNADLKECERLKPNACRPYKDMFFAEKQLTALNAELLAKAQKRYAFYAQDDANYLSDIAQGLADVDRTWRAYRDAQCTVSPFLEGMARVETGDLAEACRLKLTRDRIKELKGRNSSPKDEEPSHG